MGTLLIPVEKDALNCGGDWALLKDTKRMIKMIKELIIHSKSTTS